VDQNDYRVLYTFCSQSQTATQGTSIRLPTEDKEGENIDEEEVMKFLYKIIDSNFSYKLPSLDRAESNLFKFQLPAHDSINFVFEYADFEFSYDDSVCSSAFVFEAMVDWNVVVVVNTNSSAELWETLVNLNNMKLAAMLTQQLLHTHFNVFVNSGEVAPKFKQFIVAIPESPHAVEFMNSYHEWVRLAEEISGLAEVWSRIDNTGINNISPSVLNLSYFILHMTCFSALQLDPEWLEESHVCGPFISYHKENLLPVCQLFYNLIEDQKAGPYLDRSLDLIADFFSEETTMNILETIQQVGCFSVASRTSWLNRK